MTHQADTPEGRLAGLLKRIQVQPDAVKTTLQGRAVSRSDGNLHLATSTGLVAIPIDSIEDVTPVLPSGDPNLVSVSVKDHAQVRHLLKLKMVDEDGDGGAGTGATAAQAVLARRNLGGLGGHRITLPPIFDCASFTNDYLDTETASGGVLDATDDVKEFLQCDDHKA